MDNRWDMLVSLAPYSLKLSGLAVSPLKQPPRAVPVTESLLGKVSGGSPAQTQSEVEPVRGGGPAK